MLIIDGGSEVWSSDLADPSPGWHVGAPLRGRSIGSWFVSASRRIDRPDGSFGGIAVAAVEFAYYDTFYRDLNLGPMDGVALLHADSTLIARAPQDFGLIGRTMPKLSNFPDLLSKKPRGTYVTSSLFDGERRIVSYRVVGGYPLVIAAALGWDALLANWWRAADAALFCFAVVAVLVDRKSVG